MLKDPKSKAASRLLLFVRYAASLLAVIGLCLGAYEAWLQYQENGYLAQVAGALKTGQASHDLEAAVNFAYTHITIGEGKYGLLRASALDILDPSIGGQCGEFTRVTVLLLQQMGYSAHRVYLFPAPEPGQAFDPRTQPSFHVLAEVWTGERWAAIDPLRGLVFYTAAGELATLSDLAADPQVLKIARQTRPVEVHRQPWGEISRTPLRLERSLYDNPQGFNWGYLARVPGLFPLTRSILGDHLGDVSLPPFVEEPHAMLAILFFGLGGLAYGSGLLISSRLRRASRPVAVYAPVPA